MSSGYPHDINVDLHMHSTASDGALAPDELVRRARIVGVVIVAQCEIAEFHGGPPRAEC